MTTSTNTSVLNMLEQAFHGTGPGAHLYGYMCMLYGWKYLILSCVPNRLDKNIGRFKFGDSVQDRHTYNNIM